MQCLFVRLVIEQMQLTLKQIESVASGSIKVD